MAGRAASAGARRTSRQTDSESFRRPPTAQAAVLAELRTWISEGRLRPGEQVLSDAIASELGVSRVPVREALRILEGEGQVTYTPHQGYFVAQLSLEDLVEIYRIRALLEREAIRVAVPRMQAEDIERMTEAIDAMAESSADDDIAAHALANRRYHFAIFDASGMPHLIRLIRMLWDATAPYRSLYFNVPEHRDHSAAEHAEILDAVRAGDAKRAVKLLDAHRQHTIDSLHKIIERAEAGSDALVTKS